MKLGRSWVALSVDSSLLLDQPEAELSSHEEEMTVCNIPERIALEWKQRSPNEQLMYFRFFQVLQHFLK